LIEFVTNTLHVCTQRGILQEAIGAAIATVSVGKELSSGTQELDITRLCAIDTAGLEANTRGFDCESGILTVAFFATVAVIGQPGRECA
jgi:hypothetical protein